MSGSHELGEISIMKIFMSCGHVVAATRMRRDFSFIQTQSKIKINIASDVRVHDAALNAAGTIDSCSGVRILRPKRGPGSAFVEGRKSDPNAMCTFIVGRYFLRHQIVPRPIYKVAGTVPAHFDQGFSS